MNVYATSALLGATTGLRTSAGPFAAHWIAGGELPTKNAMALGGEMVADKMPFVGSRTALPSLFARASAAVYAAKIASRRTNYGALAVAAASALAASFLARRAREALAHRLHVPQALVGLAEDALVVGLVYAASRTGVAE